jgi:peptidoglycan/xylan/chitin deacetylase (PgdA/CDA1 family)
MLKFRSASILVIILAVVVFLLMICQPRAAWLLLPLGAVYLARLVAGSANIRSGFYLPAFCKGETSEKIVALTFDDGPDGVYTPKILAILEKHKVPATFFVMGRKGEKEMPVLRMIHEAGHSIGNHSYSHAFFFDLFGKKKMERDLLKAEEVIRQATGIKPVLFRPPYGVTNPILATVVKKLGYKVIGWSLRSFDTTCKDADRLTRRLIKGLHPGAIILMHDNREIAARVLEIVILKIRQEGYEFVRLDELVTRSFAEEPQRFAENK